MANDQALYDAYDGIEIPLRDGRKIRCRPLNVKEGVRFYRLLIAAQAGDPEAHLSVLDEFPAAVGIEDELLTPAEVFILLDRFLAHRGTPVAAMVGTDETTKTPKSSTTG